MEVWFSPFVGLIDSNMTDNAESLDSRPETVAKKTIQCHVEKNYPQMSQVFLF